MKSPKGCRTRRCTTTRFEAGGLYFKDATGVGLHELHGRLYRYFRSLGGVQSGLGFPTSDVRVGSSGATSATFESGKITCTKKGVCSVS